MFVVVRWVRSGSVFGLTSKFLGLLLFDMSMCQRIGYVENVEFCGMDGSATVKAKCDTGAARTSICESLGEEIGLDVPVNSVTVHSSNGSEERDVFLVDVIIGSVKQAVEVSVTDREGMNYNAIVGRDVLDDYLVDSGDLFVLSVDK